MLLTKYVYKWYVFDIYVNSDIKQSSAVFWRQDDINLLAYRSCQSDTSPAYQQVLSYDTTMYKKDLVLNKQQWLIRHKSKQSTDQPTSQLRNE